MTGGKYMALYSEKVMDHFRNPRNVGVIEDANGVGEVGNAKCGDIMKIYLKIENNIIEDVKFETFGCGSAIASSSMATELIKGKPLSDALNLTNRAVTEALDGLPTHKIHCSVLAEEAIKSAVKDYYDRNGIQYDKNKFGAWEKYKFHKMFVGSDWQGSVAWNQFEAQFKPLGVEIVYLSHTDGISSSILREKLDK